METFSISKYNFQFLSISTPSSFDGTDRNGRNTPIILMMCHLHESITGMKILIPKLAMTYLQTSLTMRQMPIPINTFFTRVA